MVWWLFGAKAKAKRSLRTLLNNATRDGNIDAAESQAIGRAFAAAGMTDTETYTLRFNALRELARKHVDRESEAIDPQRAEWLGRVADWLKVPLPDDIGAAARRGRWLTGDIAPLEPPAGMMLKRGEAVYLAAAGSLYEERVVRRRIQGGSQGVSIRIAKGLSYRVGASRGVAVSEREAVAVSDGELVMTNARVVFLGDRKGFEIPYAKLTHLQAFADGAQFSDSQGRVRQVRWRQALNSHDMASMMTGAMRRSEA